MQTQDEYAGWKAREREREKEEGAGAGDEAAARDSQEDCKRSNAAARFRAGVHLCVDKRERERESERERER